MYRNILTYYIYVLTWHYHEVFPFLFSSRPSLICCPFPLLFPCLLQWNPGQLVTSSCALLSCKVAHLPASLGHTQRLPQLMSFVAFCCFSSCQPDIKWLCQ